MALKGKGGMNRHLLKEDMQMAGGEHVYEEILCHLSSKECKKKELWDITSHHRDWHTLK